MAAKSLRFLLQPRSLLLLCLLWPLHLLLSTLAAAVAKLRLRMERCSEQQKAAAAAGGGSGKSSHRSLPPQFSPEQQTAAALDDREAAAERSRAVCVVTGASSGLGAAAASSLAAAGFHVILACRSLDKALKVHADIISRVPSASLHLMPLDLHSPSSILSFSRSLSASLSPPPSASPSPSPRFLFALVNNAAVIRVMPGSTAEGVESTFCSNYFGHFLLTLLLLPLFPPPSSSSSSSTSSSSSSLLNSPRIINVSSFTHRAVRRLRLHLFLSASSPSPPSPSPSPPTLPLSYSPCAAYQHSKLCLLLFSRHLHLLLSSHSTLHHISSITVDPGLVDSSILREFPPWLLAAERAVFSFLRLLTPPHAAAAVVLHAAMRPREEVNGCYLFGPSAVPLPPSSLALRPHLASSLWDSSLEAWRAILGERGEGLEELNKACNHLQG